MIVIGLIMFMVVISAAVYYVNWTLIENQKRTIASVEKSIRILEGK